MSEIETFKIHSTGSGSGSSGSGGGGGGGGRGGRGGGGGGGGRGRGGYFPRWRRRPRIVGYPVYRQPVIYNTEPTVEYTECVYATGKCLDKFTKKYGEDFIPEDCEQIGVQEFAQTLNDDCLPYTKENYSCGELKGSGDWLVGVL